MNWEGMMMTTSTLLRGVCIAAVAAGAFGATAMADTVLYSNGFEVNANGWDLLGGSGGTRVASGGGTLSAPSASGSFHGEVAGTGFTRFGGYNYGAGNAPTAFLEYRTSLAIYLDVSVGASNDTRFDYSSAVSNAAGNHRRDFIFNAGFYNTGGPNRFIVSASNNSVGNPPGGTNPVTIGTTGWYTFAHHFYDNGGVLAVDMTISDSSNNLVTSWTRSDVSDVIGVGGTVGGSRYGWFPHNAFGTLAIDNALLSVIPLPPAAWAGLSTMAGIAGIGFIRRRRQLA